MKLKAVNNSKLILALITMFASSTRAFLRHYPSTVKHLTPHRATRLFSSVDIADSDAVLELFNKSKNTVILDVRSDEEILNSGFIQTTANNPWLQVSCTKEDCPLLNVAAENMIPDKSSKLYFFLLLYEERHQ